MEGKKILKSVLSGKLLLRLLSAVFLIPVAVFAVFYGSWPFWGMVIVCLALSVYEWGGLAFHKNRREKNKITDTLFGFFYLFASFASFAFLRFGFREGAYLVVALMATLWACDSGAYFTGKIIGGAKMTPVISPNKTWSGFAGGVLCGGMAFAGMVGIFPRVKEMLEFWYFLPFESVEASFFVGVLLSVAGQVGDLYISILKRRVGAKDTGNIIPGHGGILDRIDSLLLASPVFLIIMWVVTW